jgi:hypothetical protein
MHRKTAVSMTFVLVGLFAGTAVAQEAAPRGGPGSPTAAVIGMPGRPNTFGTSDTTYLMLGSDEFSPTTSSTTYNDDSNVLGHYSRRFSTVPGGFTEGWFTATPHLPGGALLTYIELDYCDTNASAATKLFLESCSWLGECASPYLAALTSTDGGCSVTSADLTSLGYTVDNFFNRLHILVQTEAGDDSTSLASVLVGYRLRVSPAPPFQTFNDVAPGDFGFQYIEALAASGITGGCGGGNFCPNATLTRAQMAVFLAKALGLHFH